MRLGIKIGIAVVTVGVRVRAGSTMAFLVKGVEGHHEIFVLQGREAIQQLWFGPLVLLGEKVRI